MQRRVLVIEDNKDLAQLLALHLSDLSYHVDMAHDGNQGLTHALGGTYDLVILDLMLPGIDGLEVCRRLRGAQSYVPILMLTSKSSELDRVVGLEIGADDYLTKPFSIKELLARVKAIFRRIEGMQTSTPKDVHEIINVDALVIDFSRRTITIDGQVAELTAKEFDLLAFFARHPGRVYSRTQLLDQVWGYGHDGYEHTVNSHINRLRAKIELNPAQPRYILTVWGVGYKFADT